MGLWKRWCWCCFAGILGLISAFSDHNCHQVCFLRHPSSCYFGNLGKNRNFLARIMALSFSGQQVAAWSHEIVSPPPFVFGKNAGSHFWKNCSIVSAQQLPGSFLGLNCSTLGSPSENEVPWLLSLLYFRFSEWSSHWL